MHSEHEDFERPQPMKANPVSHSVYQIAGLDDRERGFNRQAPVTTSSEGVPAGPRDNIL